MLRRTFPALAAATLLLAACGGGAGPEVTDPREIVLQGLEATGELTSAHILLTVDGSATLEEMGGEISLTGTRLEGDFDLENEQAHLEFAVPPLLTLTGEVIQVGNDSYVKTSMTGAMWSKTTLDEDDVVGDAMNPGESLEQVRAFLDEEGVELEKLDDTECGERQCYEVRMTIPAELMSGAAEGTDVDPGEFVGEALVLDLLFDREEMWLAGAETSVAAESVGEFTLTLSLSAFNEPVEVEAPPADQVTEGAPDLPF